MKIEYVVLVIGAGGTGGNFVKEFARYAKFLHDENVSIKIVLIDGDKVESKNQERQPFISEDVEQYKAVTLASAIQDCFEFDNIYAYPVYIDSLDDIADIACNNMSYSNLVYKSMGNVSIPIVIGAVDNHRARQELEKYFNSMDNIFYLDSANEFSSGELVAAGRVNGEEVAPPRSFYFPEVLTDKSKSAKELSCGVVNESAPQHLSTNLFAANLILSSVVNIISEKKFDGGICYFDRERLYSKFYSYEEIKAQREEKAYV